MNYDNQNSTKIKGFYGDAPRRHTFSRLSFQNNHPPADKNSEENKDQYYSNKQNNSNYSYAVNDEKTIQKFKNFNNVGEKENSIQNTIKNNKLGFFKKLTSSIKNIFSSTKKTQKHQYCVVQEENRVSCFNNRKINTFKPSGIGLDDRLSEMSVEFQDKNKENTINNKLEGGIESTPNFNTNPNDGYNYNFYNNYNNNLELTNHNNRNVWGFNEIRSQADDFSVSHRTNTTDLSDIDLLRRKK